MHTRSFVIWGAISIVLGLVLQYAVVDAIEWVNLSKLGAVLIVTGALSLTTGFIPVKDQRRVTVVEGVR